MSDFRPHCLSAARLAFCLALAGLLVSGGTASAELLQVPGDYATIQEAIDAAPQGAVISVGPGVYVENIDFLGKAIALEGAGPGSVIDGAGLGSVVRFVSGEGPASVIDSFTIRGGLAAFGGGIEVQNSSPTILRNVLIDNAASSVGSGIYVGGLAASPAIFNNLMAFNVGVGGADPHTIQVSGSSPRIVNNTIVRNDSNAILTSGPGAPEIRNNILARNGSRSVSLGTRGRGICDFAQGTVTQYNLFFRNVRSALLTAGKDFRRIRAAELELQRERLSDNLDGATRFTAGAIPRIVEKVTPERFIPRDDPDRPSRAAHAGDPDPAYNNVDGSRNTMGFTGGPYAAQAF